MFGVQGRVIAAITVRATMGRKRAFLFAIPPVVLLMVTVALRLGHPEQAVWPAAILGVFGLSVVLPLTALIIGTSVLGAEIDDGSVVHLLATPVRRPVVIAAKFVVATVLTMAFVARPGTGGRRHRHRGSHEAGPGGVRRRAGRLGDLQRGLRHDLGGDHAGDRGRAAVRADLGGRAGQPGARRPAAVGRPVLPGHRELDRA